MLIIGQEGNGGESCAGGRDTWLHFEYHSSPVLIQQQHSKFPIAFCLNSLYSLLNKKNYLDLVGVGNQTTAVDAFGINKCTEGKHNNNKEREQHERLLLQQPQIVWKVLCVTRRHECRVATTNCQRDTSTASREMAQLTASPRSVCSV